MAYTSKYYDPVKAHEYYMKHRNLKGKKNKYDGMTYDQIMAEKRKTTYGLNDMGKAAAKQIRESINAEKKEALKKIAEAVKARLKQLRETLKSQGYDKYSIRSVCEGIREEAKAQKKKCRELYNEKYYQELDKLRNEPEFKKTPQKKGRKPGSKNKKKKKVD